MATVPDNATAVTDYLKANHNRYFCQSCLSLATGVRPANQVNQIVRPLRNAREYRYQAAPCSTCGRNRECAMYVG